MTDAVAGGEAGVAYTVIVLASAAIAALTLFSGFGLGTLLLPPFALFMPLEVAVAAVAVVHLANNLFKLALVGRAAQAGVVGWFGIPAVLAALGGAWLLLGLSEAPVLARYRLGPFAAEVTVLKLVMAVLIAGFALLDFSSALERVVFARRWLPLGGAVSGFFGGLSGHQGAFRAAFLVRAGLDRDAFIGTSVVCAVLVDCARLAVYGVGVWRDRFDGLDDPRIRGYVLAATLAAFVGSFVGARMMTKVTLRGVQVLVACLLLAMAGLLAAGVI